MDEGQKELYEPNVKRVEGNSVEVDGERHLGWIDYLSNTIFVPKFNEFKNWYKGKIPPMLEYVRGLLQLDVFSHEYNHKLNPELSEGEIEKLKHKSLNPDSPEEMVSTYLHKRRVEEGDEEESAFSRETLRHYDFKEAISRYMGNSKLKERFAEIGGWIDVILGLDPDNSLNPEYATVRGDKYV
jgi:hypothetical protein